MPLSFDFDPAVFSSPIDGDHPAGENLQASDGGRAVRSALRDLREEARRIERKADEGDVSDGGWPAARVIWRDVRDRALGILETRSRDLDIAAMGIEALARTDGFAGLAAGFSLVTSLVTSQWDVLYPVPDPEDGPVDEATTIEERLLPLQRLVGLDSDGLLQSAILHVPLTSGRGGEEYGLCHWRSSRELVNEESDEKIKLAVERGAVSPDQFQQAVASTDPGQLKAIFADLAAAADNWETLSDAVVTASSGMGVLPAGPFRDLFEECGSAFAVFAPDVVATHEPAEGGGGGESQGGEDEVSESGETAIAAGGVGSRDQAFRQLEQIAAFFERHDPHSLIAAQIRNVVRLGRLSREDYYRQLLRDEAALALLFRAAGLDSDEAGSGGSEGYGS